MDPHREVRAIVPFDFQQFRDMSFVVDGVVAAQDEDVIFLTR